MGWFRRGSRDEKAEAANRAASPIVLTRAWNVAAATTVLLPLLLYAMAQLFFHRGEEEGGGEEEEEEGERWSWWWWGGDDNNESKDGNDGEADEGNDGGNDDAGGNGDDGGNDDAGGNDDDGQRMLWWQGEDGEKRNGGAMMFVYVWSLLIFAILVWRGNRVMQTSKDHRELFATLVVFANLSFLCWILLGALAGYGGADEPEEQGFLDDFSSVMFLTYIFWIIFAVVFAIILYLQQIRVSKAPLLNKTDDRGSLI